MKYNFDEIVERFNTNSLKYDSAKRRNMPEGLIPMWVADMDFKSPPEVIDAIIKRAEHGIYGYSEPDDDYFETVSGWFLKRHNLMVDKSNTLLMPGVVFTINLAIHAFTNKGDGVLIQKPVYHPFFQSIQANERKVINNPLKNVGGRYEIDFSDFERKIAENNVKLFILCSPHNPVGRVWSKDELNKMGEICKKYGVVVVSDEIHNEFVFDAPFTSFWNAGAGFDEFSIICTATSKAFNQPGLINANVFINNEEIKQKILKELDKTGYSIYSAFGIVATKAAYKYGGDWINELNAYLKNTINFVDFYLKENIPKIKLTKIEGTYLLWLDFRELKKSQKELADIIVNKAKLWLHNGLTFGEEGEGYFRMNIATPLSTVKKALDNLKEAFREL
ncbi:MAG: pyridoxal phosphate-dependent aminotransferase [Clostridiaceae bacterium]|nr:pyridoxal phosphate-dependent aminotransferase [Clostridiaceae bacterium]